MLRLAFAALLITLSIMASAQDSTQTEKEERTPWSKPKTATFMSAVIPVSGQVYVNGTKKWWKVPLTYGLGGFLGYNIGYHHNKYKDFQQSLFAREDDDADTYFETSETISLSNTSIQTRKNYYRRNRDVNVIYITLLYAVNIIDANVDAHLAEFRVSDDMIMSFNPSLNPSNSLSNRSIGLTLNVKFL